MKKTDTHLTFTMLRPSFVARRVLHRPAFSGRDYEPSRFTNADLEFVKGVSQSAQSASRDRSLLFILGVMPRSGTNFLFEMLCRHPGIVKPPIRFDELPFLGTAEYFRAFKTELSRFHRPSGAAFHDLEWMAYAAAGFRNRMLSLSGADTVIAIKEPHVIGVDLLSSLFPNDRCILVMRDGRHVVDSFMRSFVKRRFSRSFEDVCLEWAIAAGKLLDFAEAQSGNDAVRMVKFEDVDQNRRPFVADTLSWLSIAPDETILGSLDDLPVFGSSTHSVDKSGDVSWTPVAPTADFKPATRAIVWSPEQERAFARICGAVNARAGY